MDSTILVVEDEPEIQQLIAMNLQHAGYRALRAANVPAAETLMREVLPNMVLLDWTLPETLGVTFARRLRGDQRTADIPIIMLTARAQEADKVTALDAGVDDYITKPFSTRELLARIRAVMRRCAPQLNDEVIEIAGDIEFRMLHFFMTHVERVYSRAQLLDEVWGDNVFVEERTVDVHIRRLRQALAPTRHEGLIETVRGTGYRFRRNLA